MSSTTVALVSLSQRSYLRDQGWATLHPLMEEETVWAWYMDVSPWCQHELEMGYYSSTAPSGVILKESNGENSSQLSGLWEMPLASHFVEGHMTQNKYIHRFRASLWNCLVGPKSWKEKDERLETRSQEAHLDGQVGMDTKCKDFSITG